jgi:ATP-binding cassette subfamily B protein
LLGYLAPYWYIASIAFALTLLTTGLNLIPTYITKILTDDVFVPAVKAIADGLRPGPEAYTRLNWLVLAILGIYVINTGLGTIRNYMMRWLGNKIIYDLRTSAYEHLQRLSLSFYNKKETGRLMSRISHDTERLQDFIVRGIQEFLMDILTLIGMCVVLFVVNWRLAALTLIPIPVVTISSVIFGRKMHMVFHKVMRRMASISAILADTIPGVRVVKAFAAEDREVGRFNGVSADYLKTSMYAAKLSTIYFPLMGLATFIGGIMIRFFGGRSILAGEMSLGDLMLFMGYMWRFYGPIRGLTRLNHMLQRSAAAAERVFEIMDAQPEVNDKKDAVPLPTISGDIEFDNVVFSYDGENNALDGVSFQVKAGQMIGLSGPSGAGKTTLINLLARFYDVTEGSIVVDGHDVRDVKMRSLRDQIGVVLQDPFLFHGSVADNIAYSKPRASRAEVVAAAKAANAHDFIMKFPDGYDAMVGERGTGLSGGERQRISIARAILKNPRILILDEATSSVDTETESLIQAAVERLIEGRTTFAIAHRLSTLRKADKLIILDRGEIVEQGTHNELLDNNRLYKRLVDLQSELSKIKTV